MTDLNTPDYYRRREQQERALAARAISADISGIHAELADRYATLRESAEAEQSHSGLRNSSR